MTQQEFFESVIVALERIDIHDCLPGSIPIPRNWVPHHS